MLGKSIKNSRPVQRRVSEEPGETKRMMSVAIPFMQYLPLDKLT